MTMYLNEGKPSEVVRAPQEIEQAKSCVKQQYKTALSGYMKNDAAATQYGTLISREATHYMPELWFKRYPDILYREAMPVISMGGFSNFESLKMYDRQGRAKLVSSNSNVTPLVSAAVQEQVIPFNEFHLAMNWTYTELQAMKQFQPFIETAKMDQVHRGFELAINDLVLFGDSSAGKTGLLTNTLIERVTAAADGAGGSTTWLSKTPALIMEDIRKLYIKMIGDTKRTFMPDTLYISNAAYLKMIGNLRNAVSDLTVEQYARQFFPGLTRIIPDSFLDGQGAIDPLTSLPTDIAVLMDTDRSNFYVNNSIEMQPTPATYSNYELTLPYLARTTGFVLNRAPSLLILEGI